jgi:DNA polymerase-3 subunit gamma/tau
MENLVLYRKYRPRTFSEVVGQEHVVKTITNALGMDRIAHAYLFTGSRGTGKTTIARLLAKAVNCLNPGFEPCNKCSACSEINKGHCFDLIEIDAASNRGIDEIRELRDGIKFTPAVLKKKVFIIDEVHMLTQPAFNALLKTLEEPPAYAIFVLATTEIHKVPQTIISRCQKFDFRKLPLEQIVGRLSMIASAEKVKVDSSALELIAVNADGCIRDAESLLGQVMSMEDNVITLEEVRNILGITDISAVSSFVGFLAERKNGEAIRHLNGIVSEGYDLVQFNKSLISYLRKMMVLKTDNSLVKLVAPELTNEQLNGIISQGQKFSDSDLVRLIHLFISSEGEIRSLDFPQLPLELAIVEFCGE